MVSQTLPPSMTFGSRVDLSRVILFRPSPAKAGTQIGTVDWLTWE